VIDSLFGPPRDDYREVFARHPQPLFVYDRVTHELLDVNDAACLTYGYSRKQFLRLGLDDVRAGAVPTAASEDASALVRLRRAGGDEFYADVTCSNVVFDHRPAKLVLAVDATQRLVVSAALSHSRLALSEAQELAHLGSYDENLVTGGVSWSPELYRIFGVDPVLERPSAIDVFVHPGDAATVAVELTRSRRDRAPYESEHRVITRDGRERYVLERGRYFFEHGSDVPYRAIGAVLDVTERHEAEEQMRYLANFDVLTSLPNRTLLADRLDRAIARGSTDGTSAAVLFLNLDRFKAINDASTRWIGDRVLTEIATRISVVGGRNATIARLGGDEFVVVVEPLDREAAAFSLADDLLAAVARPISTASGEISLTASIGIALFPRDGITSEDLLRRADAAMTSAKARGGHAFELYAPERHARALREAALERALRLALERGELDVAYQPIVDATSERVTGCEALARWTHDGVAIGPNEFVPIAEASGSIVALGAFVLERACREAKRWIAFGYDDFSMSVNISVRQFHDPAFAASVRRALEASGLEARHLQLEITESVYLDAEASIKRLHELEQIGIGLSIDDFGTGFSSLAYLKRLPVDWLKIDRSFVEHITLDAADQAIVRVIVAVAENLGLRTIAEGVETIEQADFLRSIGCTRFQGYYFSRPLFARDFEAYLQQPSHA